MIYYRIKWKYDRIRLIYDMNTVKIRREYGRKSWTPRSIMHGRKRPYFIVFRPFGIDRITAVIYLVVNDQIRHFPAVFDRF